MSDRHRGNDREAGFRRRMTVAHLREPPGTDHVEVMFFESPRFYRLPRQSRSFEDLLALLREARATGEPLTIALLSLESDLIVSVERS